jgi:hypothetical protein
LTIGGGQSKTPIVASIVYGRISQRIYLRDRSQCAKRKRKKKKLKIKIEREGKENYL